MEIKPQKINAIQLSLQEQGYKKCVYYSERETLISKRNFKKYFIA